MLLMIKSLILILFLYKMGIANTVNIEQLQAKFNQEVIELNAFTKRYGSYLRKNCNDNLSCYKKTINTLKSWETVQNDIKLNSILHKKNTLLKPDNEYWNSIVNKLKTKKIQLNNTQFVSIIDLEKQLYIVTLWDEQTQQFQYIGNDLISSGNIYREKEVRFGEDHYLKTPAGVFRSKQGWRSDGRRSDDNITLGYGYKDRFVFYFGKQDTIRYNTFDKNKNKIYDKEKWQLIKDQLNFAVHSHKSSRPMGQPNSHGCIRMTDELNRFLDNNAILHKNILDGNRWLHKYAKEPNNLKYYHLAGEYLIVFDKI